jgi:GTP-binding protein
VKFIDEVIVTVQSGDGGKGCVSFRRERFIPKGGPDGGDGGKGGDVVFVANERKRTLHHFQFKRHLKAENGKGGAGAQKTGRNGKDLVLPVPVGTVVVDEENGEVLADLVSAGDAIVIAKGGRGGQGNKRFATSTHRTPRFAQPGEPGQTLSVRLELKSIADVGLIGLPNAGKSTLISRISSARPRIADYPFTTLTPNLGMVSVGDREPFCVADIPGLIEGAHQGAGLGIRFLKHVERTKILLHLVDVASINPEKPLENFETVNRELSEYSEKLGKKPQLVALNKMDMPGAQALAEKFESAFAGESPLRISALTGRGLTELRRKIANFLDRHHESESHEPGS